MDTDGQSPFFPSYGCAQSHRHLTMQVHKVISLDFSNASPPGLSGFDIYTLLGVASESPLILLKGNTLRIGWNFFSYR